MQRLIPNCFKDTTLKDLDFENMLRKKYASIDITQADIELILLTLERDVSFLGDYGFMDYSLLLGVERVKDDGALFFRNLTGNLT